MTGTFQRLQAIPELKPNIVRLYEVTAELGPSFGLHSEAAVAIRAQGGRLNSVRDVRRFILNPCYKGLNPYGEEAFATDYTEENRVVSDELWEEAVATCRPRARGVTKDISGLLEAIGLEATLDGLLNAGLLLCRRCLAPLHRGRTIEHKGLRIPTLECTGRPVDGAKLAALVKVGIVTEADVNKATRTEAGGKHEINLVNVHEVDGILGNYSTCDKCGNRNLSKFQRTDLRTRMRLVCKRCKWSKTLPRVPWKPPVWNPPTHRAIDTFSHDGWQPTWRPANDAQQTLATEGGG